MSKVNFVAPVLVLALTASLHAKPDSDNFFYKKGFNDGKKAGIRIGYNRAKKELLSKLKKRMAQIKAMEAGKYLSKKHKITAPQIYQVRKPDGTLSIKVKGCRLEGELTPEEIVLLPKAPASIINDPDYNSNTPTPAPVASDYTNNTGISNGVFVPGIDPVTQQQPKLASTLNATVYSYFPNTEFYINILRTAGLPFTITPAGDNLKVRFESRRDRDNFIIKYDLQPGRDVQ